MPDTKLTIINIDTTARLKRLLPEMLSGIEYVSLSAAESMKEGALSGKRLIFALGVDRYGTGPEFYALLRHLRERGNALEGSVAGFISDGESELYTKEAVRDLALAANSAGALLPGKPLAEGTISLYNQHIQAERLKLSLEEAYAHQMREIAVRVRDHKKKKLENPRLLMIHASEHKSSNTVWLGREVISRLPRKIKTRELSLQNGSIVDCRGCSYTACLHYAKQNRCFYGGAIPEEVFPAISESDALLFLCPNYNDSVSANIMALFNRLTNLLLRMDFYDKYVFGIVVSGYSGGDIVAKQLLGSMCLNKTAMLPPRFCLMETAHDPLSIAKAEGVEGRTEDFAGRIAGVLL